MALRADISELPLGEILQLLIQSQRTGVLKIKSGDDTRLFWLQVGRITLFLTGDRKRFRIGDLLVSTGTVTRQELEDALAAQKSSNLRIGEILQNQGKLTEGRLDQILRDKFEEEIVELFMLNEGEYSFHFGETPEDYLDPDQVVSQVSLTTDHLILEAVRQIDEWQKISQELPGFRTVFVFTDDADPKLEALELTQLQRSQLRLVDGQRPIEKIIADTAISKFQMLSLLGEMFRVGAIRPLEVEEARDMAQRCDRDNDMSGCVIYLNHALQLAPDLLELRIDRFKLLQKRKDFGKALREARRIAQAYLALGKEEKAVAFLEKAHAIRPKDTGVNTMLFKLLARNQHLERAAKVGRRLTEQFRRRGDAKSAAGVMKQLLRWDPHNLSLRLDYAAIRTALEGHKVGLREYQRCLREVAEEDRSQRIDILKRMIKLDTARVDLKQQLSALRHELQQAKPAGSSASRALRQFARSRRRTILFALLAPLVLLLGNAIWNEVSARSALAAANARMASVSTVTEVSEVIFEYRLVVDLYPWSSVADEARERMEQALVRRQELFAEGLVEQPQDVPEPPVGPTDAELYAAYRRLRENGRLREASDAAARLESEFPRSGYLERLAIPVVVHSRPPQAEILIEGRPRGRTPDTLWLPFAARREVELVLEGFGTQTIELRVDTYEVLDIPLARVPLWREPLAHVVRGVPVRSGSHAYLPTDRGTLLSFQLPRGPRQPHPLGLLGQPQRLVDVGGGAVWAAAGRDCLRLDGSQGARWALPGMMRGADSDGSGGLLAVLASGELCRVAADGAVLWSRAVAADPAGSVACDGSLALLGATSPAGRGQLVGVRVADGMPLWHRDFSRHPPTVLAHRGGAWLVSTPIALTEVDAEGTVRWHLPLRAPLQPGVVLDDNRLLASDGETLLCVDRANGKVLWRVAGLPGLTAPAVGADGAVYVGVEAGVRAFDASGQPLWNVALRSPPVCAPLVTANAVLVITADELVCYRP